MKPTLLFFAFAALASAQGVQYTLTTNGAQGPSSISWNGFSYRNDPNGGLWWIGWVGYGGQQSTAPANCSRSTNIAESWYQETCTGTPYIFRVTLSGAGSDTLTATIRLTNNHATLPMTDIMGWFVPLTVTEPVTWSGDSWAQIDAGLGGHRQEVAMHFSYPSGSHACYLTEFHKFYVNCRTGQWDPNAFTLTVPEGFPSGQIPPGQTVELAVHFRFGGPGTTLQQLAQPGYEAFRAAYPQALLWEDRRIVGAGFVSDWQWLSSTNPRGHRPGSWADFLGPGFPVAREGYLNAWNSMLNVMDMYNPRPQGVVIWDMEGNEFWHVFTYVGNPRELNAAAPELEVQTNGLALIDEAVNMVRNRGYEVGFTLRPSRFDSGPGRPMFACYSQAAHDTPAYIQTDGVFPNRGYRCEDYSIQFNAGLSRVECVNTADCSGLANGAAVRVWSHDGGSLPSTVTAGVVYHICNYNEAGGHYQLGTTAACTTLITNLTGAVAPARHATWQRANPTAQEAFFLNDAIEDLRQELRYMWRRWRAKLVYIDTDLHCHGETHPWCWGVRALPASAWKTLQEEFPEMLLSPERSAAGPYTADFQSTNEGHAGRGSLLTRLFPDALVIPHINEGNPVTYISQYQQFVRHELRDGIMNYISMIEPPTGGSVREHYNNDLRVTARDVSTLTITNTATGRLRSWSGNPYDGYKFPTKLRVAFRSNSSFTGNENTYCEMRSVARCWSGGVEQSAGALNLSGFTHARVEYRAWHTDRLIHAGFPEGL